MSVDLSCLPRTVILRAGDRIEIPLPSYFGSGNIWSVTAVSGQEVARVWVELAGGPAVPDGPGNGITEPPALTLIPERAVVSALAPGEATWRLVLARTFGPSIPIAAHDLQVTVVPFQ